jgi:hypothetical protein
VRHRVKDSSSRLVGGGARGGGGGGRGRWEFREGGGFRIGDLAVLKLPFVNAAIGAGILTLSGHLAVLDLAHVYGTIGPGNFSLSIHLAILDLTHVYGIGKSNRSEEEVFTNEGRSMQEHAAAHDIAPTLRRYAATSLLRAQSSRYVLRFGCRIHGLVAFTSAFASTSNRHISRARDDSR